MVEHSTRRLAWAALAGILLVAAVLRLWQIASLPPGFHFDESFEGLEAWRILTDPSYRPVFLTGNFGVPPLNAYANAVTFGLFRLFGGEAGPTAMRVTAAVAGVAGVAALYALAAELRRLDPQRLTAAFPLLAAAVLATLRWHIHFSRMGIEPIFVPLEWTAATWLLLRGWRTGAWWSFAGCGVVLAATMYTYQGAWIIPLLMVPTVGLLWLHGRHTPRPAPPTNGSPPGDAPPAHRTGMRRSLLGSLVAAGVALALVLPLGWFFVNNPDLLTLRAGQIAVTGSQPAIPTAQNAGPLDNVRASALMFVPLPGTGDLDPRRNLPGEPALTWWQFVPFVAGLALALWRIRNPAYSITLVGLVGLLLPGVFSEYAPHFHRILGAAVPTALLCAVGFDALVRWVQVRAGGASPFTWGNWGLWVSGVVIVIGAFVGARDYFVRWAALPDLFYAFDAGLWEIGQEIAVRPPGEPVYLTPRPADHATLAFAWATRAGSHGPPVSFDGRHIFPLTDGTGTQPERYVVIEHEDFRTRLLLPDVLPQAQVVATIRDAVGEVYANVYERPASASAQRPPQWVPDAGPATLGDGITLAGYDVQPADLRPGEVLYLQLHWLADATPSQEWTVFTHLLRRDSDESVGGETNTGGWTQVAGQDGPPGAGSLPTTRWQPGWRVLDEYQIVLPADLAPGNYTLVAGLYRPDGTRLPADGPGVVLGDVTIQ